MVVGGLSDLRRPERRLKVERKRQAEKRQSDKKAPAEAVEAEAPLGESVMERRVRRIRVFAGIRVALGALGVWASGLGLGWMSGPPERREGDVPDWAPVIRKHALPSLSGGGGSSIAIAASAGGRDMAMVFGKESFNGAAANGKSVFEIGSITKVFTGIALAREVEQGNVRLDQPVQELLPPEIRLPPAAREVTLRHLTTHTSGFPRLPDNLNTFVMLPIMLFGGDPYAIYGEGAFVEGLRDLKLKSQPGAKMEYSNMGTSLLGYALARKAGVDYERYIRNMVLQPLRMDHTYIVREPPGGRSLSTGYRHVLRLRPLAVYLKSWPWNLGNHLAGAGGLRSTARDMLKFLKANMRPGESPLGQAIRRSHEELFRVDEARAIGMNWIRTPNSRLGKTVIWHNGGTGGFMSYIGFTEDGTAGVAVLSNGANSVDPLGTALLQELHAQTVFQ